VAPPTGHCAKCRPDGNCRMLAWAIALLAEAQA
jgi:hypothetical protein